MTKHQIGVGVVFEEEDDGYHIATFEDGELVGTYARRFESMSEAQEAAESVAVEIACLVLLAETEATMANHE